MAWTSPRTWVSGEVPPATIFNTHVRDNFKALGDPWTSYTPNWSGSGGNPVIGNGQISCAYMMAGKLCAFRFQIAMGSTTTYGGGIWSINLPFAPSTSVTFLADYADTGVGNYQGRGLTNGSSTTLTLLAPPTTAGNADRTVGPTVPFTWGNGDILNVSGFYEAA